MNTRSDPKQPRRRRHPGVGPARALERLGRAFGRAAAALWSDVTGAVMAMTAVMFMVIVGFTGLAIDVGDWYATKGSMQNAADAAAISAGIELGASGAGGDQVTIAARQAAAGNGFDPNDGAQVVVAIGADGRSVNVMISKPSPTLLAGLFLGDSVTISASATASMVAGPTCLLSLEETASKGLWLDSNSRVDAAGCSIQVNSTNPVASRIKSNASVTADAICIAGGYQDNSNGAYAPTPETGSTDCPPVSDPLAAMAPPPYSGCDYDALEVDDVTTTLGPGVYCDGLKIKGNADVEFLSGEYIIEGGDFLVDSDSVVQGAGVGFYLTGGATIEFKNNVVVDFSAPTDGPLAGILFFQDRNDTGTNRFDSNSINRLEGTIYFPNGRFNSDSDAVIAADSAFTVLIARRIELGSNARLVMNADYTASDVPVVLPAGGGGSGLTRLTD